MSQLSIIHPDAKIGKDVKIDPFANIAANVTIGEGTWIGSNAVIMDGVVLGKNCKIFPGAIVGAVPQDLKYKGEDTQIIIGDNVTIREYCTLNKGTSFSGKTIIGNNCLLMAYVHVAHDCVIGDNVILANAVNLAGHVQIDSHAIVGGIVAVHQFVKIGSFSMVGGGSLVRKDIPPFIKVSREPLSYVGVNSIGLRRNGFKSDEIKHIQDIYRILFVKGSNISKAINIIKAEVRDSDFKFQILEFLNQSERGIVRGLRTYR